MRSFIALCGRVRLTSFVLLSATLTACTSWHVQQGPPAQVIARERPEAVRVTRADQTQLVLQMPTVRADTLIGAARSHGRNDSIYVPVNQIRALETRGGDPGASLGILLLASAVSIGTYVLLCDCISNR